MDLQIFIVLLAELLPQFSNLDREVLRNAFGELLVPFQELDRGASGRVLQFRFGNTELHDLQVGFDVRIVADLEIGTAGGADVQCFQQIFHALAGDSHRWNDRNVQYLR
ncbi:MAG TPA: hypothetical protein HA343_01930 [Methanomassiliicoccales archaeon]|nr:hypothetical protein [Methanomassiliicoccales archaeon]